MTEFDVFVCSDVNFLDLRDVQVVRLHHPINSRCVFTLPIIIHNHGSVEHDLFLKGNSYWRYIHFPRKTMIMGGMVNAGVLKRGTLKNSTSLLDGWIYQAKQMGSCQALGKLFVKMVTLGAANLFEETNVTQTSTLSTCSVIGRER